MRALEDRYVGIEADAGQVGLLQGFFQLWPQLPNIAAFMILFIPFAHVENGPPFSLFVVCIEDVAIGLFCYPFGQGYRAEIIEISRFTVFIG